MSDNWYLYRDENRYGPYSGSQMIEMLNNLQLFENDFYLNTDYSPDKMNFEQAKIFLFPQQSQPNIQYQQPYAPPAQFAQQPQYSAQNPYQPPQKRKKKSGCIGCLSVLLIICMLIGSAVWYITLPRSDNLKLAKKQSVVSAEIEPSGGIVTVSNENSPIDGMTINVPSGSYDKKQNFKISTTAIDDNKFGEYFVPITPLITVDNGHKFSNELMTVSIPIQITKDEFAMAFYYDKSYGTLEGIPLVSLTENQITITTSHFSDLVVSKILKGDLDGINIDTGFVPGYDDWQFVNNGSFLSPNGNCAGQSISSMWYYYEKYKKAGERRLYGRYDNNDYGMGTINLDLDDSWSYRYVNVLQKKLDFDSNSKKLFNAVRGTYDYLTFYAFAYTMLLTGSPQYVGICYYEANGDFGGGHAVVAYKIENNLIYIADPNYPGDATRKIEFGAGDSKFIPYQSGANAEEIKKGNSVGYTSIGYFAISSMIDWGLVGGEYEKMTKGQSGINEFPKFDLYILKSVNKDTGAETYAKCPDAMKITEADTEKISPNLIGKLKFKLVGQYSNQCFTQYKETEPIAGPNLPIANKNYMYFTVELDKGINNLGFYSAVFSNNQYDYVDFKRIRVTYEQVDLSGTYTGNQIIRDGGKLFDFLENVFGSIFYEIGLAKSLEEGKSSVRASMETSIGVTQPITVTLEAPDPKNLLEYDLTLTSQDSEGLSQEFKTTAKIVDGKLEFTIWETSSASFIKYSGAITGDKKVSGDFEASVWGFLSNAFSGDFEFEKIEAP